MPQFKGLRMLVLDGTPITSTSTLALLKDLPRLENLSLARTKMNVAGLIYFQGLPALRGRAGRDQGRRPAGTGRAHGHSEPGGRVPRRHGHPRRGTGTVAGAAKLRRLVLDGNPIVGGGLRALKDLPQLTELGLGCPDLADLHVQHLSGLTRLRKLSFAGSGVGDECVKFLSGLADLQDLDLTGTRISPAGVAVLQKRCPSAGSSRRNDRRRPFP